MTENKSTEHEAKPAAAVHAPAASAANGLAIASLVTGIVAFVFGWTLVFGFLAGVAAIVLGALALKKHQGKGLSIAGIITGAVGALTSFIIGIFFIIGLAALSTGATGEAIKEANNTLSQYNAENKALVDAKKEFKKGETAKFGKFEVKANSISRDYDAGTYLKADDGSEYIVVNVTVKNTSDESEYFGIYDLKISDGGVITTSSYIDADPSFKSADLEAGASQTGNIVYEVKKGSTDLTLQYEANAYDLASGEAKALTFKLAL